MTAGGKMRRWKPGSSLPPGELPYARLLAALYEREQRGDRLSPYHAYLKLWCRGKLEKAIHPAREETQHALP